MDNLRVEVGQQPVVHVRSVAGDLRLVGRSSTLLEAQGAIREEVAGGDAGRVELSSPSGCLIYLPEGSKVEIGSVGGDGRVTGLGGPLTIGRVGGDLTVRGVGSATIRRVDGDLHARDLDGDLQAASVGGAARVEAIRGDARLEDIGSDVTLRGVEGNIRTNARGDGAASLTSLARGDSSIEVGGDLSVRLPPEASVRLRLHAGGDMALALPAAAEREGDATIINLGSADANLTLRAGGDLSVRLGGSTDDLPFGPAWQEDLAGRVQAQVEAALSQAEAAWRDAGAGMEMAGRVRDQVRRSMDRARGHRARVDQQGPPEARPVASEERMQILRMLEKGTISVEQAEKLFEALEGKG